LSDVVRALCSLLPLWLAGTTLAFAQAPPPANFPGTAPPAPPAVVRQWQTEPATVAAGESAILRWEVLNAYSLIIEPEIGTVATRGTRRVSPAVTTTYTLKATGANGTTEREVTVTVEGTSAFTPPTGPSSASGPLPIPRLADGKPDLSGLYIAERNLRLAGNVTLVPGAERFRVEVQERDLGTGVDCLPPGVPATTMLPFPLQIVHRPDVLAILYEAYHQFRIVPIGREHAEYLAPAFMGHSVARWDGDTLVVDVRGFNDQTVIAGYRHTEDLRVIEHYRRTAYDTIAYDAYVVDPNVFAAPLRYAGTLTLHPEWEIGEYVCNENNQDYDELFDPGSSTGR
jgi:hypothetical protein